MMKNGNLQYVELGERKVQKLMKIVFVLWLIMCI